MQKNMAGIGEVVRSDSRHRLDRLNCHHWKLHALGEG